MDISADIEVSLPEIWNAWWHFRHGKRRTPELDNFIFNLESELRQLESELASQIYLHGSYRTFVVDENKKRTIHVAAIRDRVAHRLLYDYLVPIFDKTFIPDLWSCRKGKGLLGAILRTQELLRRNQFAFVWRSDVKKFFDSVDQETLLKILGRKLKKNSRAFWLAHRIIKSYQYFGTPIGNITSQIFANIYLNEFDQFVAKILKPIGYLRYGDDFIIIHQNLSELEEMKKLATDFLADKLKLTINRRNDIVVKVRRGIHFLGVEIFPFGRRLLNRAVSQLYSRLGLKNISSYSGIIRKHGNRKAIRAFDWRIFDIVDEFYS